MLLKDFFMEWCMWKNLEYEADEMVRDSLCEDKK